MRAFKKSRGSTLQVLERAVKKSYDGAMARTGRPREFDTDVALEKARDIFWASGYNGTSIGDLVEALALKRGSIYAAFGDKRQLYLAAVELYWRRYEETLQEALAAVPLLPALRDVLRDGEAGVDGALAIAGPLLATGSRASREDLLTADRVLAAEARGEGPDAAPPACADQLRVQAQVWAMVLDPDGAEPCEAAAMRKRAFTLGVATEHGVPVRGMLMPEVAAQFQRIVDAVLNPRVDPGAGPGVRFVEEAPDADADMIAVDTRSRAQKQHDILAMTLGVAASSELLPTIGGAAPTLVVTVREEDLVSGRGWAHLEGATEPVALTAATHAACTGTIQRIVLDARGRITSLGTEERVFNRRQRRAIAARDGGCIIPGCAVPAGWCEIHHVVEHAQGGPTHTDNGVLLCWYHHRHLESSGWLIRMNRGVPEVMAPTWNDPYRRWRAVTTSKTRMLNAVLRP